MKPAKFILRVFLLSIFITLFLQGCNKDRRAAGKLEGKHNLISFSVDGVDSLGYLNNNHFNCSDYFFEFNYLRDKGDHNWVRWNCKQNDSSFTVVWYNTNKTLSFDSSYRHPGFGPFEPFGYEPSWNFEELCKKKFIISREKDGKKYRAHFEKFEKLE